MAKIQCDKCGGSGFLTDTLSSLRKQKKLTQSEVADQLGMQRSSYAMVEMGKSSLLAHRILPLAELLEVTTQELLEVMYAHSGKGE